MKNKPSNKILSDLKNNPVLSISGKRKLYIETYGCQMNVNDSEVVVSILQNKGIGVTGDINDADIILVNTCSIRDNAEQRIWGRLRQFKQIRKKKPEIIVGVIGCMAERLKEKLLETDQLVDLVIGPDAYRDLPNLLEEVDSGQQAINVLLSREETYADISPVRMDKNNVSAFVAIMRGCNNFCSYCVVPYTRGQERSRNPESIIREVSDLIDSGYKEVTLLGQNVNSYHWKKSETKEVLNFSGLIKKVAQLSPALRVRFSTSHPKDISDELLYTIAEHENICRHIHLPVQSGSTRILKLMNRVYTRESYLERIHAIKRIIPDVSISSDIIAGFCGETEEDHQETLSLMKEVNYDFSFMFKYSERPGTDAAAKLKDDVPEEIKTKRLNEIIALQRKLSETSKKTDPGNIYEVLVEGVSKKSKEELVGRTTHNKVVVFPGMNYKPGDYVMVKILRATSATLIGVPVAD